MSLDYSYPKEQWEEDFKEHEKKLLGESEEKNKKYEYSCAYDDTPKMNPLIYPPTE